MTTSNTQKVRISKKLLAQLPSTVATEIAALAERYGFKSMTVVNQPAPYKHYFAEGDRNTFIYGNKVLSMEMVSENTIGASEVRYEIGAEVSMPTGTTILNVWYYAGFGLRVINVGDVALPAPKSAVEYRAVGMEIAEYRNGKYHGFYCYTSECAGTEAAKSGATYD